MRSLPVAAFEAQLRKRFTTLGEGEYDDFLDWSVELYSTNLDQLAAGFQAVGGQIYALEWQTGGQKYYSLLVPVPEAESVIFEVIGVQYIGHAAAHTSVRHPEIANWTSFCTGDVDCELAAMHVSYPATDAAASAAFWQELVPGATLAWSNTSTEYRAVVSFPLGSYKLTQIHFVQQRTPRHVDGAIGVAEWESFLQELHASSMRSPTSGFDQYLDYHIGISNPQPTHLYEAVWNSSNVHYRCFNAGGQFGAYWATPQGEDSLIEWCHKLLELV